VVNLFSTQNNILPALGSVLLTGEAAKVTIFPSTFTLQPGMTQTAVATFTALAGLDKAQFPVYSGFIDTSGSENYYVSCVGLAASLKDKQVLDSTSYYFDFKLPAILDTAGEPQVNSTFANGDNPTLLWQCVSKKSPWTKIDTKIDLKTTISASGFFPFGHFFTFPHPHNGAPSPASKFQDLASLEYT